MKKLLTILATAALFALSINSFAATSSGTDPSYVGCIVPTAPLKIEAGNTCTATDPCPNGWQKLTIHVHVENGNGQNKVIKKDDSDNTSLILTLSTTDLTRLMSQTGPTSTILANPGSYSFQELGLLKAIANFGGLSATTPGATEKPFPLLVVTNIYQDNNSIGVAIPATSAAHLGLKKPGDTISLSNSHFAVGICPTQQPS